MLYWVILSCPSKVYKSIKKRLIFLAIEKSSGLLFFPNQKKNTDKDLCKIIECKLNTKFKSKINEIQKNEKIDVWFPISASPLENQEDLKKQKSVRTYHEFNNTRTQIYYSLFIFACHSYQIIDFVK